MSYFKKLRGVKAFLMAPCHGGESHPELSTVPGQKDPAAPEGTLHLEGLREVGKQAVYALPRCVTCRVIPCLILICYFLVPRGTHSGDSDVPGCLGIQDREQNLNTNLVLR